THVTVNLSSFMPATDVKLRWHAGDDSSFEVTGWFVDSVTLSNVGTASSCTPNNPATPTEYYTLTPCRLVDTRNAAGPLGGPALQPSADRTFVLTGSCGVPSTAKAVAINATVVNPTAQGFLTLWPADVSAPLASTINFVPAVNTRANNAIVSLAFDASGGIKVKNGSAGTVDFILDVVGYFQ